MLTQQTQRLNSADIYCIRLTYVLGRSEQLEHLKNWQVYVLQHQQVLKLRCVLCGHHDIVVYSTRTRRNALYKKNLSNSKALVLVSLVVIGTQFSAAARKSNTVIRTSNALLRAECIFMGNVQ